MLRFLQVLSIAPVFPLVVAGLAPRASGEAIGFVNSARIGAAFLGPVLATTLLAWGPPALVYLALAGAGFAVIPVLRHAPGGLAGRHDHAGQGPGPAPT
jgi:MFS family permease